MSEDRMQENTKKEEGQPAAAVQAAGSEEAAAEKSSRGASAMQQPSGAPGSADLRELREEEREFEGGDPADRKVGELSFKLQKFEGPLDLLLHLIDKNKVDIYDIPIAEITDQYMDYVNRMHDEDLNVMSEFLVMAATLLDIKCRMLLPREVNEEGEEEDPRDELVAKLLAYKVYRYMSQELRDRMFEASHTLYRRKNLPKEVASYRAPVNYEELLKGRTLADLSDVFRDILKRQKFRIDPVRSSFGTIEREEVDLSGKELYIKAYLNSHRHTDFKKLLESQDSRDEVVVTFLVILELMKNGNIRVTQDELFGNITIETVGHIDTQAGSTSEFTA